MTTILILIESISDYSNLMQMTVFYFSSVWERFPSVYIYLFQHLFDHVSEVLYHTFRLDVFLGFRSCYSHRSYCYY